jgi:hypothetical protein
MANPPDIEGDEAGRILAAARDGRLLSNKAGRYVIEGEKRPDAAIRRRLLDRGLLTWAFNPRGMRLTNEGRAHLERIER